MIKILSEHTINKIAAGEVIERPASVVKELVENSIDAGATKIDIILECAGKNLILIRDNGHGMTQDELLLAIQRHATSKLDEEDLLNIHSFGFRGEALPSIGAISKLTLSSKHLASPQAHSVRVTAGKVETCQAIALNAGTTIEVRDLFFATPARLKFLRTDRTELNAIIAIVKKIALAHPHIAFQMLHDNKSIFKVSSQRDYDPNSSVGHDNNRIGEILSQDFIENAAQVNLQRDDLSISGYTSIPTYNRASAEDQFLFVNGRPVKDKILNIALKVAYQDYLARDRHPVCVLFLKLDPHLVDVNSHPAKTEVRFYDANLIRSLVINAIRDALQNSSQQVSTTTASKALDYLASSTNASLPNKVAKSFNFNETSRSNFTSLSKPSSQSNRNPANWPARSNQSPPPIPEFIATQPLARHTESEEPIVSDIPQASQHYPLGAAKAQLYATYIVSQTDDSIIITDQHAAHERLRYEKIKQQIAKNGLAKQRLLMPEIVELPDTKRALALQEHQTELGKLGLSFEPFGEKSVIVTELPSLIGEVNVQKLLLDIAEHVASMGEEIALSALIEHVTETYACHYSIRAGRVLDTKQMNELLREMENTPFSGQCNHGRQTYIELKRKDIEKLFGR